ncbi:MAG: SDR family NAD(P)-dependent oxidoreductase [Rhodospirillales bacterium]|nr:SDR family NAD(P)-dependent oxidoreductase [Rhodospirillales bacterium]
MDRLKGKVAIITGAGSGIGRTAAQIFAAEGAKIAVAEIDPASGAETVALVEKAGGTAQLFKTDVADPAAVEACVKQTVTAWRRLDILYNNAGGMAHGDGSATEVAL